MTIGVDVAQVRDGSAKMGPGLVSIYLQRMSGSQWTLENNKSQQAPDEA